MNDDCVILLMPVRIPHEQEPNSIYFVTFTCYNWLPLFEITNSYDLIYKWFDYLYSKNIRVAGYVIMPNHIHLLLYFPEMTSTLNTIIGNAKRMLAYEIIKRLVKKEDERHLCPPGVWRSRPRELQERNFIPPRFQ